MMVIKTTLVKASELNAGDLFSTLGPEYWQRDCFKVGSIGEKVYIRTEESCPSSQMNIEVYRLTVIHL